MSDWKKFEQRDELDRALADSIADSLRSDIESRGCASLAVSGGSTPKGLFALLATAELDWSKVWVTLVDERWVAPDHADSNEKLVRENLLQGRAASANFIGLKSSGEKADDGLAQSLEQLKALPFPLSCTVLGMGGDGHTASWFPQASNLAALLDPNAEAILAVSDPVTAPHSRITLTMPAVLNSSRLIVHITGEDKRAVINSAAEKHYPIAAILDQQTTPATIWWAP